MRSYINLFSKSMTIIILLLSCFTTSLGQEDLGAVASFDFRKTRWKMTKAEVKEHETAKLVTEKKFDTKDTSFIGCNEIIAYDDKAAGMYVQINYFFLDDHLSIAAYSFREKYENKTLYFEAYGRLRKILTKKHGPPIMENEVWLDDRHKPNQTSALVAGDLKFEALWKTTRTAIALFLQKDINADKIAVVVVYKPIQQ